MITEKETPLVKIKHLEKMISDAQCIIDDIREKCQHNILPGYLHPYDKKTGKIIHFFFIFF